MTGTLSQSQKPLGTVDSEGRGSNKIIFNLVSIGHSCVLDMDDKISKLVPILDNMCRKSSIEDSERVHPVL